MIRDVKIQNAIVIIKSDTGDFEQIIKAGSAKSVGDAFIAIGKYLKLANHSKHGLSNIELSYN